MKTANRPSVVEAKGLSRDEIEKETSNSLAADLIERGLKSRFYEMNLTLIQIADSGLIARHSHLQPCLENLVRVAEGLDMRGGVTFPGCWLGSAKKLVERTCRTLVEQTEYFRQEHYWTQSNPALLIKAEELIRDLFHFYAQAEFLMRQIDAAQPDDRTHRRIRAPQFPANPYAETVPA